MKKFALVLSGGGFKGAFQVGALQYLKENWNLLDPNSVEMKFDIVAGVSVGSLNGLLVASNKFDKLQELWADVAKYGVNQIYESELIETSPDNGNPNPVLKLKLSLDTVLNLFPKTKKNLLFRFLFSKTALFSSFKEDLSNFKAIADNTPLRKKLKEYAKKSDVKCIFKCGYVSLNDGQYYSKNHTDFVDDTDFVNGILASTAMPIIWKPVPLINTNDDQGQQKHSVDGGVRNVSPLGDVIKEINKDLSNDEYTIVIINCS